VGRPAVGDSKCWIFIIAASKLTISRRNNTSHVEASSARNMIRDIVC
jgi:hypothetical protein